ncbi:hypothetical protein MNEG_8482 [Monoraphidium neglectum]|uniref:Uncharacterized protein n=1 Tax=Monoraphidium neglectum TaxID=145388 RepID=A0A0D2JJJ0_9CHLO|nr:hypothetical protein MNEG_8482 [Monoraphidium neglectum]KIY99477.1 hypothetical protein MNEG_8482 [Monoraphidium neglectum]|eukprot:XP_013898497.1 hypothetical protein MNEG_8482 [Monoraphidium neglectum]
MAVNQLNETGSQHANVTLVGVAMENLAPGDAVSSTVAAPFSIAVVNNVWPVLYNRSAANDVRLALFNTTMVIPLNEISYVTYMFTLFTSSLPYLKQQTTFYTDVIHISILQVMTHARCCPAALAAAACAGGAHGLLGAEFSCPGPAATLSRCCG